MRDENIVGLEFDMDLSGRRGRGRLRARIVDLVPGLGSITVPEEFLAWANEEFAGSSDGSSYRLGVLVEAGHPAIRRYAADRGLVVSAGVGGGIASLLEVAGIAVSSLGAFAALFLFLAVAVGTMSLAWGVSSRGAETANLAALGWSPRRLALTMTGIQFRPVLFVSIGALVVFIFLWYIIVPPELATDLSASVFLAVLFVLAVDALLAYLFVRASIRDAFSGRAKP